MNNNDKQAFEYIRKQFINNRVVMLETTEKATNKPALLLCFIKEDEENFDLIPFGTMFGQGFKLDEHFVTPEGAEVLTTTAKDFEQISPVVN